MRFGSIFSGIEAASAAWHPLGWETAFVADPDAFASSVLAHRLPGVPNLGDVTADDFIERARACGPIDLLVGGSPCQAFSVAGKRQSLDDARGNLTLRYVEICDALDPEYVLWENVPGVLSTKDNAFGHFLGAMAGESGGPLLPPGSKWSNCGVVYGPKRTVAWRVLNAEYFGVAQRRKRIFVLSARSTGAIDPFQVLAEHEGLRRDSAPQRATREGIAARLGSGPAREGVAALTFDKQGHGAYGDSGVGSTLTSSGLRETTDIVVQETPAVSFSAGNSARARGIGYTEEATPPLRAAASGSNQVPTIAYDAATVHCLRNGGRDGDTRPGHSGVGLEEELAYTLQAHQEHAVVYGIVDNTAGTELMPTLTARKEGGGVQTYIAHPDAAAFNARQDSTFLYEGNVAGALDTDGHTMGVLHQDADQISFFDFQGFGGYSESGVASTLKARDFKDATDLVVHEAASFAQNQLGEVRVSDVSGTLNTNSNATGRNAPLVLVGDEPRWVVRRLTPKECERLQGFPDDWTLVPHRGKPAADGPRYKACGNSMAVPVMSFIGRRLADALAGVTRS